MGDCRRGYRMLLDDGVMRLQQQQAMVINTVTSMLLSGDTVFESPAVVRGRFQPAERFSRGAARAESPASQTPPLTPQNLDDLKRLIDANPLLLAMEFQRGSVKTTILHSLLFHMSQAAEQRNFGEAQKIAGLIDHILKNHKNSVDFTKTDSDGNTIFHRVFWYAIKADDKRTSDRFLGIAKTAMEDVAGATSFKKILAQKNKHRETFIDNIDFDLNAKMGSLAGSTATERSQRQQDAIALAKPFLAKMAGTAASSTSSPSTVFDFREGPHKFSEYVQNLIQDPITFEPFNNPMTDPKSGATLDDSTWRLLPQPTIRGIVKHPYTREDVVLTTLESNDYLQGFARVYTANSTEDPCELWTALRDYRLQNGDRANPHDRTTADCHALLDAFARQYGLTVVAPAAAVSTQVRPAAGVTREESVRDDIRSTVQILLGRCASYIQEKNDSVKPAEGFASFFRKTELTPVEQVKVHGVRLLQQAMDNWISDRPGALEKLQKIIYVKCCLTGHGEDLITKDLFSGTGSSKVKNLFFEVKTLLDQQNPDWQRGMRANALSVGDTNNSTNFVHHVEPMFKGGYAVYGENARGEVRVLHVTADAYRNGYDGKAELGVVGRSMSDNYRRIDEHFSISASEMNAQKKGK